MGIFAWWYEFFLGLNCWPQPVNYCANCVNIYLNPTIIYVLTSGNICLDHRGQNPIPVKFPLPWAQANFWRLRLPWCKWPTTKFPKVHPGPGECGKRRTEPTGLIFIADSFNTTYVFLIYFRLISCPFQLLFPHHLSHFQSFQTVFQPFSQGVSMPGPVPISLASGAHS